MKNPKPIMNRLYAALNTRPLDWDKINKYEKKLDEHDWLPHSYKLSEEFQVLQDMINHLRY